MPENYYDFLPEFGDTRWVAAKNEQESKKRAGFSLNVVQFVPAEGGGYDNATECFDRLAGSGQGQFRLVKGVEGIRSHTDK